MDKNLIVGFVPFSSDETWEESAALAATHLPELERDHGRGVIVLNAKQHFGGVLDRLAASRPTLTPRSPAGGRGPALSYCPGEDSLLLAQRVAVGGLLVVAWDDAWVMGWARQWHAIDLRAMERVTPFTDEQQALLDNLHWNGNNGWPKRDPLMRSHMPRLAAELRDAGLAPHDAVGAMLAKGHSKDSLKRLAEWLA